MIRLLTTRLGAGLLTLMAVSLVVFLGTEALPGDAATAALGQSATPESVEQLRQKFGLNEPVLQRYWEWLTGFLSGDVGTSLPSGDPVSSIISGPVQHTLVLGLLTIIILVPLAVILGVLSAVLRDRSLDHGVSTSTLVMISTPEFVIGTLLVVIFAVWWQVLPAVSLIDPERSLFSQAEILVLPVATLIILSVAQMTRMIRACMIDVLDSPYIEAARLDGIPERRVLFRHALPNALGPTFQILAFSVAWLAGGVVVVESVFQYQGVGLTFAGAVSTRDVPTVQAIALLVAAIYVVANVLADIATVVSNPRLRRAAH